MILEVFQRWALGLWCFFSLVLGCVRIVNGYKKFVWIEYILLLIFTVEFQTCFMFTCIRWTNRSRSFLFSTTRVVDDTRIVLLLHQTFGNLRTKEEIITLPKTNSSHLNMDGWNTIVSFWDILFSGAMLVSGRVISYYFLVFFGQIWVVPKWHNY